MFSPPLRTPGIIRLIVIYMTDQKPPDTEKDEEEDAPSSVAPPMVVKPGVGDLVATAARPAQTDAPVDDSLMSALTNPRERGHVLQIERLVFEFAQTA